MAVADHAAHDLVIDALRGRTLGLAGHAFFETYVQTRFRSLRTSAGRHRAVWNATSETRLRGRPTLPTLPNGSARWVSPAARSRTRCSAQCQAAPPRSRDTRPAGAQYISRARRRRPSSRSTVRRTGCVPSSLSTGKDGRPSSRRCRPGWYGSAPSRCGSTHRVDVRSRPLCEGRDDIQVTVASVDAAELNGLAGFRSRSTSFVITSRPERILIPTTGASATSTPRTDGCTSTSAAAAGRIQRYRCCSATTSRAPARGRGIWATEARLAAIAMTPAVRGREGSGVRHHHAVRGGVGHPDELDPRLMRDATSPTSYDFGRRMLLILR